MITSIVLALVLALGIILMGSYRYKITGTLLTGITAAFLLLHVSIYFTTGYSHERFVVAKNSFEQTLKVSRELGNNIETATIVKSIAKWNMEIADRKYNNSTLLLNQYIDDRIELIEPIQ